MLKENNQEDPCTRDDDCLCDRCYDQNIKKYEELEEKHRGSLPKWMEKGEENANHGRR